MTSLAALCECIVDCEHKTAPAAPSGFPLIRTPNIRVGRLDVDSAQRVNEATYRAWTKRAIPQPGDLILAREAPVGNVGPVLNGVRPALGQRTVLIRPRRDVLDPMYLNYLLSGPQLRGWMDGVASGATVPHLNVADIRSMELPALPPLLTQRKIATVLSAYDDLTDINSRQIKILEEMAQRIYREWFVDFRYPGHENMPMSDSELGPIPDAWKVIPLSGLAAVTMGQSPPSSAYNRDGLGLPFHQGVGTYGTHFPHHEVYSTAGDRRANEGDVLLSVRAPVGRINVADRRMILGRGLCGIGGQAAPSEFLLHALKHVFHEEDAMGGGTIFKSVTRRDVEGLQLIWPGSPLAARFVEVIHPMWRKLHALTVVAATLRATRDLLLPRLVSGDIDLADSEIAVPDVAA